MQRARSTTAVLAVAVLLLGALGLAGCGGSDETSGTTGTTSTETTAPTETTTETETEQPTVVNVTVVDGQPQGGIVRATVAKDERVSIVVTSDVADEIHVHGYDLAQDVEAGGTATIAFVADLPGRFEVELEEHGTQIADLTVEP